MAGSPAGAPPGPPPAPKPGPARSPCHPRLSAPALELLHAERDFDPFAIHFGLQVVEPPPPQPSTDH